MYQLNLIDGYWLSAVASSLLPALGVAGLGVGGRLALWLGEFVEESQLLAKAQFGALVMPFWFLSLVSSIQLRQLSLNFICCLWLRKANIKREKNSYKKHMVIGDDID